MFLKRLCLLLLFCSSSHYSFSQWVVTDVVPTPLCATGVSNEVTVIYWAGGYAAGNVFTVQLSDNTGSFASPVILGTLASVTNGSINCTIPGNTPAGAGYLIRIVSSTPVVVSNTQPLTLSAPAGLPITSLTGYGNGTWNALCYTGYGLNWGGCSFTKGEYYCGSYTENNLSINTATRWATGDTPSNANAASGNAYSGCPVAPDAHAVEYRRTGFTCDYYTISLNTHDDQAWLTVNGNPTIATECGCCDAHPNLYTGVLTNTSTVVFKFMERGGQAQANLSVIPVWPVTTAATGVSTATGSFTANWNAFMGSVNYYLDVSTSATFSSFVNGYNDLPVGNVTSYTISGLPTGVTYYYRIRADIPCGISSNSNVVSVNLPSPLPVELVELYGTCGEDGTRISWITATETNNDHFEVEKSTNGFTWEYIGSVNGHGTTVIYHSYMFIDNAALPNVGYYRLDQVDFNGDHDYSPVIAVSCEEETGIFFPSLWAGDDQLFFTVTSDNRSADVSYRIYNVLGEVVAAGDAAGLSSGSRVLVSKSLGKGAYIIAVVVDNKRTFKKFLVD